MPRVTRTDAAERDIDAIWLYLAEQDIETADRFLDRLDQLARLLAAYPKLETPCEELSPGVRAISVKGFPYIVFFRGVGDDIGIVRVLHGHQDSPSRLAAQ